ncbi:MAG: hypothetical protein GX442_10565 [Candidatus Riflebacteria bacterium]|nr:hypothetical protein [Candidatus Riflebacteria bacterium]
MASGSLTGLLRNAAGRAAGLAGGLLILLGLSGEIGCTLTNAGGVQVLHLDLAAPRFVPLVLEMVGWDLLVFGLAWFFLMRIPATPAGSRGRAALSLILSLSLWRVVAGRAWALATDTPGPTVATASGILAWWVYAALVAVVKEPIAQTLLEEDERQDSPLLSVFAWHHRKDGVFSLLGALGLTLVWFGMPAAVADDLQNLVKIGLLGTAAMRIGHRCLSRLTVPDGSLDHPPSPPVRAARVPLPPEDPAEFRNGDTTKNRGNACS